MKLVLSEVDCSRGFEAGKDIFSRQKLSHQLESIIKNSDDESLVLAINDEWGSGKTTFLKMWESQVNSYEDNKLKFIYFDAFKNDYQEDAFIALSSAIYPIIDGEDKKKNYIAATKKAGAVLIKTTAKVAIKAITLGVLNGTELEGSSEEISDALNEPIENIIQEKLENSINESAIIEHFKTTITEAAGESKIIFVIDELDRSRPDFSLDLLEKIKHVFDTKNIYFVLAVNKEQFIHAIKKRYGNIDADTYLSKFIHFWFTLPNRYDHQNQKVNLPTYLDYLRKANRLKGEYNDAIDLLSEILTINGCSLRDAERCYSCLMIVASSGGSPDRIYQFATAVLVFLKIRHPKDFDKITSNSITPDEIYALINVDEIKKFNAQYLATLIFSDLATNEDFEQIKRDGGKVFERYGERIQALKEMLHYFDNLVA